MSQRTIHWFRKGLRLHDNPALLQALEDAGAVFPVFVLDPWFAGPERVGVNRYRFLLESLQDLDSSLRRRHSRLLVAKGKPAETFEYDSEPYARRRDEQLREIARDCGVEVLTAVSHTLWDPRVLVEHTDGHVPTSYTAFLRLTQRFGLPPHPLEAPDVVAWPRCASLDWESSDFDIPALEDVGYEAPSAPSKFPGGEHEALARLDRAVVQRPKWVATFEKPKTSPNSLEPATTVLSPYLKFGCLSPRRFYAALKAIAEKEARVTQPPVSLVGQLLWREFFYANSLSYANFDRMEGNPICRQIPWDDDAQLVAAWAEGRTGYPWIDAVMRQLREEGWIHHLARHAVACFLTRGDLYQSWEKGAKVFDRLLLDADWAINNGNWMWLSASAYFYQYFRVYSPVAFPKKTDPEGHFVQKWVPEVRNYPKKYIYEPWKAPVRQQQQWGCVIGRDYPERIVIHEEVSKKNMARHKAAYDAHKEGKAVRPRDAKEPVTHVGTASPAQAAGSEGEVAGPPAKRARNE